MSMPTQPTRHRTGRFRPAVIVVALAASVAGVTACAESAQEKATSSASASMASVRAEVTSRRAKGSAAQIPGLEAGKSFAGQITFPSDWPISSFPLPDGAAAEVRAGATADSARFDVTGPAAAETLAYYTTALPPLGYSTDQQSDAYPFSGNGVTGSVVADNDSDTVYILIDKA